MLLERLNTNAALQQASELDLSDYEAQFRRLLPDVPAKNAMVSETLVEYRRFVALRHLGSSPLPSEGSLLGRFLELAPDVPSPAHDEAPLYRDVFGHDVSYVWRTKIEGLLAGDPMPGGGAGTDHSEM